MKEGGTVPLWFCGAWKREWIQRARGPLDGSTAVRTVQTPTLFGDVRIPDGRPRFPHATSLSDLGDADLASLCKQQGFAGVATLEGDRAIWHHQIDYQPPDGALDAGRIERAAGRTLFEHAPGGAYVERWWQLSRGDQAFFGVHVARWTDGASRTEAILAVAGDHFVFARNRAVDLPVSSSLAHLIASTNADRARILAYLDCEVSHGLVQGGRLPWEIHRSTLPFLEGRRLDFVDRIQVDGETGAVSRRGDAAEGEIWSFPVNTCEREDLRLLFPEPACKPAQVASPLDRGELP